MIEQPIRIGTKASKLAIAQAGMMRTAIARSLGDDDVAVLVQITTSGHQVQDRRLMDIGGKGLFAKEIEEALLQGRVDAVAHSDKGMPSISPKGLAIAAIPEREDPLDAFLSVRIASLKALPRGDRPGAASLGRQARALYLVPTLTSSN